jgi:hypothetical protein
MKLIKTVDFDEILELAGKPTPSSIGTAGGLTSTPPFYPIPSTSAAVTTNLKRGTISDLVDLGYWVKATGSRVTEDGWDPASDWDYVVFDPEVKLHTKLIADGWTDGTSGGDDRNFASLRMNAINLILVKEEAQWKKWIIATNMIKALNSKTKEERVKVFDGVFGKDSNAEAVLF